MERVISIVKLILRKGEEERLGIGRTRLVKLLYLLEVEYYRLHQSRLTDLKWRFYHFGPYTLEIQEILGAPELEAEEIRLSEDRIFYKLQAVVKEPEEEYLTPEIDRLATMVVKRWGGLDLRYLLDYVYFETEPMIGAKPGDILDFSTIKPWQEVRVKPVRIRDRKKFRELRERIKEHLKDVPEPREIRLEVDKVLLEGLKVWNGDASSVDIKGRVEIE